MTNREIEVLLKKMADSERKDKAMMKLAQKKDKQRKAGISHLLRGQKKYYETRYNFEHTLLPYWFYNAEKDELMEIRDKDTSFASFLWGEWKLACEMKGLDMRDAKNPFKVSKCTIDNDCTIVRIDMPKPDREYCCFQVYLAWSNDYEHREYFTVERSATPKVNFLCLWDEMTHRNYGTCRPNEEDIEGRILKIFLR